MSEGLVYIGKIIALEPIPGADFIVSATVVCGSGGKWRGVVKKSDFQLGSHCTVFLPDAIIPQDMPNMAFMKDSGWRVKMRRFKGAPSEVVISHANELMEVGTDVTHICRVTKYHKPVPAHLNGIAKGNFPDFIPKTDEPNYQREPKLVEKLIGRAYYVTEKADGSSTTAFKYKGQFGLCSRNLELQRNEDNGYWKVALKYDIENTLPEGIALQWETCGPGIQSNPMGLKEIDGFAFSAYNIPEHRYLNYEEFTILCNHTLRFPKCRWDEIGQSFSKEGLETKGEGLYANGKPREGVVVRSCENVENGAPISFKVINLGYER